MGAVGAESVGLDAAPGLDADSLFLDPVGAGSASSGLDTGLRGEISRGMVGLGSLLRLGGVMVLCFFFLILGGAWIEMAQCG